MPIAPLHHRMHVQEAFMQLHEDVRSVCEERWKAWNPDFSTVCAN